MSTYIGAPYFASQTAYGGSSSIYSSPANFAMSSAYYGQSSFFASQPPVQSNVLPLVFRPAPQPPAPAPSTDMSGLFAMIMQLLMQRRKPCRAECPPPAAPPVEAPLPAPVNTTTVITEPPLPKRTTQNVVGGATLNGSYTDYKITDDKGDDVYHLGGNHNSFEVKGDSDPNHFYVGGKDNVTRIYEIGSDDKVFLEGGRAAWEQKGQGQDGNGVFYDFYNAATKSTAKIYSDHNDFNFLNARIQ